MGYKMKSNIHSLLGINKELSTYNTPVFEKNLGNVWGVANNDRTIFVNSKLSKKNKKHAAEHEHLHVMQMRMGLVNYDNKNIYFRNTLFEPLKKYARKNIKAGKTTLPWEKQVYDITKKYAK